MKKPLPLTGSSLVSAVDPELKKFRLALRKQLLKVAQTHPVAHTRALFQAMADGSILPQFTADQKPETSVVPPAPAEFMQSTPLTRVAPSSQGLISLNAPEK